MNVRALLLALAIALLALGYFMRTPDTGGVALRDFEAYYAAGATWHYHGDPYGRDVWRTERTLPGVMSTRDELLPFVGPPFGLPFWDVLSRLPWLWAVALWRVAMALSFAIVVLASLRIAAGKLDWLDAVTALAMGAAFAPITSGAALGQVALPACAAIVATPLLLRVRFAYAAAFGAVVAALQPNLAIALVARLRERRSFIAASVAIVLALGGSIVATHDIGGIAHYFMVLRQHSSAERDTAIQTTVSGVAIGFGATSDVAGVIAATVALAVIVGLGAQCFSRRYSPDDCLVLACAALPLVTPFAHEHDFNITFLPALVVAYRARGTLRLLGIGAAIALAVDWLGLAQRPGSTLEACAFALAIGMALAVFASRIRTDRWGRIPARPRANTSAIASAVAVAAFLTVCVAVVAIPAATHVLPTWPDRLPTTFSAVHTIEAPDVWHAEQAASGITAIDPYWALLRAIPLCAAVLLWGIAGVVLSESLNSEPLSTQMRPRVGVYPSA